METKNIQEFLALAKLGSSYAAAEQLFISQSSLVRHIQAMEEEFGVSLFDRNRRGFVLNTNGQIFLPYAEKIARTQTQCFRALHPEEKTPDIVRLAVQGKVIDLVVDFKKEYPDCIVQFEKPVDLDNALWLGTVDLAFLPVSGAPKEDFITIPFSSEEVLVVVHREHPLAARESVHLEELREERFVGLCEDTVSDDLYLESSHNIGFTRKITAMVPTGEDLFRMVREQVGITMIHGNLDTIPDYPGLKVLQVEPRIEYKICMCYPNSRPLTEAAKNFVNFAKKWRIRNKDVNLAFDAQ